MHDPFGAVSLVYALLLDEDLAIRAQQVQQLRTLASVALAESATQLMPLLDDLDPRLRLPLVELAMPALRGLSSPLISGRQVEGLPKLMVSKHLGVRFHQRG